MNSLHRHTSERGVGMPRPGRPAAKAALIYALFAGLWILFSDRVLEFFLPDAALLSRAQTAKGWLFVAVTGVLLFLLVRRYLRRQAAEAGRFRQLIDGAADAVYVSDMHGRLVEINQHACRVLGYTREELLELTVEDVDAGTDKEQTMRQWRGVLPDTSFQVVSEHRRKDGSLFPVEVNASILPGVDGVGGTLVIGFARDITDRLRMEAERDRLVRDLTTSNRELLRARNYASNIIDSMPSILVSVDAEGRITDINRAALEALHRERVDVLGRPVAEIIPDFGARMDDFRKALVERNPVRRAKEQIRAGGGTRYGDVVIYPLVANGVDGAVIRVDDVTDRVRAEEMLVQSEKMLSVGGLAAGMAHEINNPLGIIMQAVQGTLRRLDPKLPLNVEAAREAGVDLDAVHRYLEARQILLYLDSILDSGARAARIVSSMLDFSRRSDSAMAPNDLNRLVERALELAAQDYDLKKRYDFRHIRLVRDLDESLPPVPCTASEIVQVLLNLVRNAAQAIAESDLRGEPPTLTVRTRCEDGEAVLEVANNGDGMDEATRRRVFEPFFTTKPEGVGTGLGLSVSSFIISVNHGGAFDVDSAPGKGARFTIRLPLVRL